MAVTSLGGRCRRAARFAAASAAMSGRMGRFLLRLLINALALWLTTLIVAGASRRARTPPGDTLRLRADLPARRR